MIVLEYQKHSWTTTVLLLLLFFRITDSLQLLTFFKKLHSRRESDWFAESKLHSIKDKSLSVPTSSSSVVVVLSQLSFHLSLHLLQIILPGIKTGEITNIHNFNSCQAFTYCHDFIAIAIFGHLLFQNFLTRDTC